MSLLHVVGGATEDKLYVEDVFSTYLYTGNGSTQTINNGIDLAGKGGMVWIKDRQNAMSHNLFDTGRGVNNILNTNLTLANQYLAGINLAFNSNGFSQSNKYTGLNNTGTNFTSWTFRKAPKFFDIVTYTGDDNFSGRQIAHSLGVEPGMIMVKKTSGSKDWEVWHRSLTDGAYIQLNSTTAQVAVGGFDYFGASSTQTATYFTLGDLNDDGTNRSGATYVAYLFAHDTSADGIIQCGSFSGNTTVTLGWEPQWMMIKRTDSTGDWITIDNMRGCSVGGIDAVLFPNLSSAESVANDYIDFTPTGFISKNLTGTYIYTVIRRPMKVPTSGTEVYNAIARTGTAPSWISGFTVDAVLRKSNKSGTTNNQFFNRLACAWNSTNLTDAENQATSSWFNYNNGFADNLGVDSKDMAWMFKRAKGFFDIVCYTGTGVARTVNHNLGVVPELMIVKKRIGSADGVWYVYSSFLGASKELLLNMNLPAMSDGASLWNSTAPTLSTFSIGTDTLVNASTHTFVTYLFATCPNVSKVFNYTGNGSSLNVECGFSAGARFVLCKRTDSNGDWFVFDSVRGIVAANDPHLSLNTIDAEVTTDDSIDPYANGFTVNQNATTNLNVNGGTYIGLAIA